MTQRPSPLRVLLVGLLAGALSVVGVAAPAAAKSRTEVTMKVDLSPRYGEFVWFSGYVTSGGKAQPNRRVSLQYQKVGTNMNFRTITSTTSTRTGKWAIKYRPVGHYRFRVVVSGTSTHLHKHSPVREMNWSYGTRTLEDRVGTLGDWGGIRQENPQSRLKGKVRWQNRDIGLFVQHELNQGIRTYMVQGQIRSAYTKSGGVRSGVGLPIGDAICSLIADGCKQRFTNGVIYDNPKISPSVVTGGNEGYHQVLAVAQSQVGYSAPRNNISKYNQWVGTNNAWCSIFLSWAARASGNQDAIPVAGKFTDFHAKLASSTPRGSSPRVGAIAIFDTHLYDGVTRPTHAGLVIGVENGRIRTIEGNTTNPATGTGRGVYYKNRSASQPLYYFYPKYGHGGV